MRLRIAAEHDVARAVLEARRLASGAGFGTAEATQFSTGVSELVRNILKYAVRGQLQLDRVSQDQRSGIEAVASDNGPGIEDIEAALQDHVSTGGTLGLGLPGLRRMMDEFDIRSTPGKGTTVTIRKWRTGHSDDPKPPPPARVPGATGPLEGVTDGLAWSCYVRPCFGHRDGGDAAVVVPGDGWILAGIVDVLGHGEAAVPLARSLSALIRENAALEPKDLLELLHRSVKGSLGAAVSLCRIRTADGSARFVGVGNTALRVLGRRELRLHSVEGVVGERFRSLQESELRLESEELLLLYTDGVSDRFQVSELPELLYAPPTRAAREVVAHFGKRHDDASCIAVRFER